MSISVRAARGLARAAVRFEPAQRPLDGEADGWLGLSVLSGFWNTICSLRLIAAAAVSTGCGPMSAPSSRTAPSVARSRPGQHLGEGRLAAARFADDGERHAAAGIDADVVERLDVVARSRPKMLGAWW